LENLVLALLFVWGDEKTMRPMVRRTQQKMAQRKKTIIFFAF
jgi:hypothetical protein